MRSKQTALGLILVLLLTGLACNLPVSGVQPRYITVTPNQTMTALFGSGVLGTLTAQAVDVKAASLTPPTQTATTLASATATAAPTDTQVPTATTAPSATPIPSATPTGTPTGPTPTVTAPPTLTPGPGSRSNTASGGAVGYRSPVFSAAYLSSQPALDGGWEDWSTDVYSAGNVTYGAGNWTGSGDLDATFRVGWDNNYLYIAAKIADDSYVQNASGNNLYLGDSLEILLDTNLNGDFYYNQLSPDDYQLGISPGRPDVNGAREAYLWFPSSLAGSRSQIQIASMRQEGITRIEAFIPWSVFNVSPAANKAFGFALSVSDNDNTAANQQQSMVSSSPNRHLTMPTTWGELILTK